LTIQFLNAEEITSTVEFRRGDSNCDGRVDELDALAIAALTLASAPTEPCCSSAADVDDDGDVDLADQSLLLRFLLDDGPPPLAPGPVGCGTDPTPDVTLGCSNYAAEVCSAPQPPVALQFPGDCTQDGRLDLSDAVCLLGFLYLGLPQELPCGNASVEDSANVELLDWSGDGSLDISDAVGSLAWLFAGGSLHPAMVPDAACVPILGCPATCSSADPVQVLRQGTLTTLQHGVQGRVEHLSNHTLRLRDFFYDGEGFPTVVVWLHKNRTQVEERGGIAISADLRRDEPYVNETLVFPIPSDVTLERFGYVSIWCSWFPLNYGVAQLRS
jgi:hypothetical protein